MHFLAKKQKLTEKECTKSKYALPIKATLETGINDRDGEDTSWVCFDKENGKAPKINYNILIKLTGFRRDVALNILRTEEEINKILESYWSFQNNS